MFYFITGKASAEFKDTHVTVPEGAPPITPYTKANIQNGYIMPRESPFCRKSECSNFLENKIGLVLYTQIYRLMQNSTIWLAESY